MMHVPLILASGSATRQTMLRNAGIAFTADAADVDEAAIKKACKAEGKSVEETALRLAQAKAEKVAERHKGSWVLGADQMLECEGRWLDKAATRADAEAQLQFLSGKTHRLVSAAVLVRQDESVWQKAEQAVLHVRPLSKEFITHYCEQMGDLLLGSVGCYAVEGLGMQLMEAIEGDHFVILGLPLLPLMKLLREKGLLAT